MWPTRVAAVAFSNVGATFAYARLLSGLADEIVLIDINRGTAEGADLNHALPFTHPAKNPARDFADCAGATVVVLAAGVNQKRGQTRLDPVYKNAAIRREIVPEIVKRNRHAILLIATNPVDALT